MSKRTVNSLPFYPHILCKFSAFTLAEVLITLGIIGVVAAITMPTLIQNYQKQVYVTQLKKFYSTWEQGFQKMLADDGVERLSDTELWGKIKNVADNNSNPKDEIEFFKGLQKYIKFEIPSQIQTTHCLFYGNSEENIESYPIQTPDGASILVYAFSKSPNADASEICDEIKKRGGTMCSYISQGFVIDVNGTKKPNIFGRDIFQFAISDEGRLYPYGGKDIAVFFDTDTWKSSTSEPLVMCDETKKGLGGGCAARIMEEGWKMNY